jgi:hypothetical protein
MDIANARTLLGVRLALSDTEDRVAPDRDDVPYERAWQEAFPEDRPARREEEL